MGNVKILESYDPKILESKLAEFLRNNKNLDYDIHYSNSQGLVSHAYTVMIIFKDKKER